MFLCINIYFNFRTTKYVFSSSFKTSFSVIGFLIIGFLLSSLGRQRQKGALLSSMEMANFILGDNCNFHYESMTSYDYPRDYYNTDMVSGDIVDLLPSDPFSMDVTADFKVIIDWLEDFRSAQPNENLDGCGDKCNFSFQSVNDNVSEDTVDIVELLPSDPFSMDINAKFKAFMDCIEEFEDNLGLETLGFGLNKTDFKPGDDDELFGFNLVWKESLIDEGLSYDSSSSPLDVNIEELMGISYDKYRAYSNIRAQKEDIGCSENSTNFSEGAPHEALFYALGYLEVRDLLCVERVCKSLKDAVQNDPLLWKSIHLDRPLTDKITDNALLKLTSRAQGDLQSLSVIRSFNISDNGIKCVLERNPRLTKLSVAGCLRLSIEGILFNLKIFSSNSTSQIKHLRTGGSFSVTTEHLEELKFLLGATADTQNQCTTQKPRYYSDMYLSLDDDRQIDVEMCPRCENVRQVYDCPSESCKHQNCRACTFCIARCIKCGCCLDGRAYEETFCLDSICLDCWKKLLKCPGALVEVITGGSE